MNKNTNSNNNNTELGALWKKKSKTGVAFLSGYVKVDDLGLEKEIKVVVFANNKKSNDKAPDYRIYISKPLDSQQSSQNDKKVNQPSVKKPVANAIEPEESEENDLL